MILLGINSGYNRVYQNILNAPFSGYNHDSAAALIIDGKVVYAIEEERLNRVKHTNAFPENSIRECLAYANINLEQVDKICFMGEEKQHDREIEKHFFQNQHFEREAFTYRNMMKKHFKDIFGYNLLDDKVYFVNHHIAHAASSYYTSEFNESLVIVLDGYGDNSSGLVIDAKGNNFKIINRYNPFQSLGDFYCNAIALLGYNVFDEYKVMGLAPYGNPEKYRRCFNKLYRLLPEGAYETSMNFLYDLFSENFHYRRKGEAFTQEHMDFAAGLQEAFEKIYMHVITHYATKCNRRNLCLAGGVTQNCSATGKIYYESLFDRIYIQPGACDSGGAIGAALYCYYKTREFVGIKERYHSFLGSDIEYPGEIEKQLNDYNDFLNFQFVEEIEKKAALLLATGKIIGWVQGRTEFGPRALGNRSILADPRPFKNKDIINEMIKKRESYRPFAPSILEENAQEYYEIYNGQYFDFMNIVLRTCEDKKDLLGAVTHVDRTARVQTVCKETNPRYWNLINEFYQLSGIPILLNTSFNNNAEPIVNTCNDAIVCYLTTELDYLVIGNYLISRKKDGYKHLKEAKVQLPLHIQLRTKKHYTSVQNIECAYELFNVEAFRRVTISEAMARFLGEGISGENLQDYIGYDEALLNEVKKLWSMRYLTLNLGE